VITPSNAGFLPVIVFGFLGPALSGRDRTVGGGGGRGIGNTGGLDVVVTEAGAKLSRRWQKSPGGITCFRCTFTGIDIDVSKSTEKSK